MTPYFAAPLTHEPSKYRPTYTSSFVQNLIIIFDRNNIYKRKKTYPDLIKVLIKKVLSPIGCTAAEKTRVKLHLLSKKLISRKNTKQRKVLFFFDMYVSFTTVFSGNQLSFAAHQMHR